MNHEGKDSEEVFSYIVTILVELLQVYINAMDPEMREATLEYTTIVLNSSPNSDLLHMKTEGRA